MIARITTCIDDLSGCLQHFPSVKSWWDFFKRSIRSQITYFSKNTRRELSHEGVLLVNRIIDLKLLVICRLALKFPSLKVN